MNVKQGRDRRRATVASSSPAKSGRTNLVDSSTSMHSPHHADKTAPENTVSPKARKIFTHTSPAMIASVWRNGFVSQRCRVLFSAEADVRVYHVFVYSPPPMIDTREIHVCGVKAFIFLVFIVYIILSHRVESVHHVAHNPPITAWILRARLPDVKRTASK